MLLISTPSTKPTLTHPFPLLLFSQGNLSYCLAGFPPNPALLGSSKPRSAGFRQTQPANPALAGREPSKAGFQPNPALLGFNRIQPCWVRRNPALAG
ncbi:hypothetical protein SLEP1_g29392 [Rubroshorea leprosula]|uniref:Uncharacterized protein n=1 Tax=Rubroshorea leprosula TaxID=152421 RepID=A0AAV5K7G5_9ROSI|nr:hypothetical protein SLEP1_g29392 [Rubroshorea leprosula]